MKVTLDTVINGKPLSVWKDLNRAFLFDAEKHGVTEWVVIDSYIEGNQWFNECVGIGQKTMDNLVPVHMIILSKDEDGEVGAGEVELFLPKHIEVDRKVDMNLEEIEEIMGNVLADANAFSYYWCASCNATIKTEGNCVEDKWFNCLKKGGKLEVISDDGEKFFMSYETLKNATIEHLKHYNPDGWDANDADEIFQIASMGKVVYC